MSKFNREQNDLCEFCKAHSETIQHLLWSYQKVTRFWNQLADFLNRRCTHAHNLKFNEYLVLFGECLDIKTDEICNLIILMAKFYIYRCKVRKVSPNIKIFIKELYNRYCMEKHIHQSLKDTCDSWKPYEPLIQSLL